MHASRRTVPVLAAVLWLAVPIQDATGQMETYRHATGFSFQHPSAWRVQQVQEGLALVPPDAAVDAAGQPLEVFLVGAQAAPGIGRPDDPQVLAFFDQALAPMRRVGEAVSDRSALGPAVVLTYRGQMGAVPVQQRVYVTLHGGQGYYLLHTAREDLTDGRTGVVREVFASFAMGGAPVADGGAGGRPGQDQAGAAGGAAAGNLDPDLIGTWRSSTTTGSTGGGGSVWATDRETVTFGADGTVVYSVGTTISGDVPGVSAHSTADPNALRGQWSIQNGMIVVRWADGSVEQFEYRVFIHTDGLPALRVNTPGGRPRFFR